MAIVEVLAGTQSSARTEKLDRILRQHLGHALLLTPTHQSARKRQEELLLAADVPGAWGRPVLTLQSFAETIVQDAEPQSVGLSELERRLMLQGALSSLRRAGKLEAAGPGSQTEGFLHHLLRVIENLKQAAIEPEEFIERIQRRPHPSPLDSVVALAYQAYQAALIEHCAYDLIGVYWQAHLVLEAGRAVPLLNGVDLVAFDGFDDFTESEFRLITALGKRVGRMVFAMRADMSPGAADLYELQRRTVARIEKLLGTRPECLASRPPVTYSEHASSYLLWRGETPPVNGLTRNLEVVPCSGVTEEVETVGRAIKTLILDGTPPAEIAIVYREMGEVWDTLRSMAREFQIPLRLYGGERLAASSVCAFVLDALDASAAWRHGEIVELLISPWMDTDGAEQTLAGAIPVVCRLAGIVAGSAHWQQRLQRLREDLVRDSGERDRETAQYKRRNPRAVEAVDAAIARVRRFAGALSGVPVTSTIREFSRAAAEFAGAMQLGAAVRACASESVRARETAALESFQEMLGRLSGGMFGGEEELSRADFARFLRQACASHGFHVTPTPRERQGVRCLDMQSLRGLRFQYVFFGGVNEGVTPSAPGVNAVYSEDDVKALRALDIPLELQEFRVERDLTWFHHVLEAPREKIWLLWRTATPEGKPLLRSPFLNDVLRLFPGENIERAPLRAGQYYPPLSDAASTRDALNNVFATKSKLPELLAARFVCVTRGADIEKRRYSSAPFDASDGVLAEVRNKEIAAATYGEDHVFSATELEIYRTCPFKFFALRMLRLMQVERPDTSFDRIELGIVVHRVLEEFHRRYEGVPLGGIPPREAAETMRALVESVFDERKGRMITVPEGIAAAERLSLHERLQQYLEIEREEESAWRPSQFEAVFGQENCPYQPLPIQTEAGLLRMCGRIDRIDAGDGGFRVIDYKTGSLPKAEFVKQGVSLQLVVYALALEKVIAPGATCVEGLLLKVGTRDKQRIREDGRTTWEHAKEGFLSGVTAALRGIRGGWFPPTPLPDVCAYCDARRMCRIDSSRIERKLENAG